MSEKIKAFYSLRSTAILELNFEVDPRNYIEVHQFAQDLKEKFSSKNSIKADVILEIEGQNYRIRIYLTPLKRPVIEVNKFVNTVQVEAKNHGIELTISKS